MGGIRGLEDFYLEPQISLRPAYTANDGSHALPPGDLAVIYDFAHTFIAGPAGQGQAILLLK